jgi:hypothetical protein
MMPKLVTICDHIGRTVIGRLVDETESVLQLRNPVIIFVQPDPKNGQLKIDSYPYIFIEFIDKGSRDTNVWTFTKASVVVSDVVLDERIVNQYEALTNPPPTEEPKQADPRVIKLFDE